MQCEGPALSPSCPLKAELPLQTLQLPPGLAPPLTIGRTFESSPSLSLITCQPGTRSCPPGECMLNSARPQSPINGSYMGRMEAVAQGNVTPPSAPQPTFPQARGDGQRWNQALQGRAQVHRGHPGSPPCSCSPPPPAPAQAKVFTMDKGPSRPVNSTEPEGRVWEEQHQAVQHLVRGWPLGGHSASGNLQVTCTSGQWG